MADDELGTCDTMTNPPDPIEHDEKDLETDWTKKCENCGQTPIVPATGLCGPCTFGEAETMGGNW